MSGILDFMWLRDLSGHRATLIRLALLALFSSLSASAGVDPDVSNDRKADHKASSYLPSSSLMRRQGVGSSLTRSRSTILWPPLPSSPMAPRALVQNGMVQHVELASGGSVLAEMAHHARGHDRFNDDDWKKVLGNQSFLTTTLPQKHISVSGDGESLPEPLVHIAEIAGDNQTNEPPPCQVYLNWEDSEMDSNLEHFDFVCDTRAGHAELVGTHRQGENGGSQWSPASPLPNSGCHKYVYVQGTPPPTCMVGQAGGCLECEKPEGKIVWSTNLMGGTCLPCGD